MHNFVIVGTQRTGSSTLGEAVGLHPDVACGWEWTQRTLWWKKLKLAEQALDGDFSGLLPHHREYMTKVFGAETEWLGFRRLFGASNKWLYHPRYSLTLLRDRFEAHIGWFRARPNLHIIHIIRRDNLDWLKSKFVAGKTNAFIGSAYPEDLKVTIPIQEAIARIRAKHWIDIRLASLKNSNPYIPIIYEDILQNRQAVVKNALEFMQCDSDILPVSEGEIKRQSTGSTRDYIANYEQLVAALNREDLLDGHEACL